MAASVGRDRVVIFTGQGEFSWDDFCDHTEEQKVVTESASTLHKRVTWSSAVVATGVLALIFASQISQFSFLANSNFRNYFTEKSISVLGKGLACLGALVMQWQAKEIIDKTTPVSSPSIEQVEELSSQIEERQAKESALEEKIRDLGTLILGETSSETATDAIFSSMQEKVRQERQEKGQLIQALEFEGNPPGYRAVISRVIELVRTEADISRLAQAVGLGENAQMQDVILKVESMVAELAKNNKEPGKSDKTESRSRSSSAGSGSLQTVPSSPTGQRMQKPPLPSKKNT